MGGVRREAPGRLEVPYRTSTGRWPLSFPSPGRVSRPLARSLIVRTRRPGRTEAVSRIGRGRVRQAEAGRVEGSGAPARRLSPTPSTSKKHATRREARRRLSLCGHEVATSQHVTRSDDVLTQYTSNQASPTAASDGRVDASTIGFHASTGSPGASATAPRRRKGWTSCRSQPSGTGSPPARP